MVDQVIAMMIANSGKARALVKHVVPLLGTHEGTCRHGCHRALAHTFITTPKARDPAVLAHLDAVAGRLLGR